MKRIVLMVSLLATTVSGSAWAQTPVRVPFQGVLTDGNSAPISASLPMTFAIYATETAATALWTETQTVPIGSVFPGVYTVMLGSTTTLNAELFRDNNNPWLGLRIGSDPELGRFPLGATPLSAHSKTANGTVPGSGGTNDPDNRYVNIDGDTMTGRLNLPAGGVTVGTSQLMVTAAGNVGIGTATPNQRLEVSGTSKLGVTLVGNAARDWGRVDYGGGGADNMFILYALSGNVLRMGANGSSGHMIIDTAGNVGVGTLTPSARLTVGGGNLRLDAWGEAVSDTLAFSQTTGGDGVVWIPSGALQFKNAAVGAAGERVTFRANGDVGIGTSQPQAKLDVRGVANVGRNALNDNTDYGLNVLRHGLSTNPGTYSTAVPGLHVLDYAGDGPATMDLVGIARVSAPRISDADTNAHNASLLIVANDSGTAFRVDGRANSWVGYYNVANSTLNRSLFVEGVVGIGRTAPLTYAGNRLDVDTSIALSGQAVIYTDGTTTRIGDVHGGDGLRPNLTIMTNDTNRIWLDGTGLIGVHTTTPQERLHVNSNMRLDGNLDLRGAIMTGAGTVVNVIGDERIGLADNPIPTGGTAQPAGWGNALVFSGGPDVWADSTWGRDNSDPLWMARYNPAPNQSELRMVIGDDPGQNEDRLVIGAMQGSGDFSKGATWVPRFTFGADGRLDVSGDLDIRGRARLGGSDIYFTDTAHDHTGIGNAAGWAAIENGANYNALMILGRSTPTGRRVRLWDYLEVNGNLDVTGAIAVPNGATLGQTRFSNSDIYFTNTAHNHTGIGNTAGWAAIENGANYDALMILGRATPSGRRVRLWDYLEVNGNLDVTGAVTGAGSAFIATANRSSLVVTHGANAWQDVPGLAVSFFVPRNARAHLSSTGEQRTPNQSAVFCHIGYRFVVDGVPRGNGTWGQRIQVSRGDLQWWTTWSLTDYGDFGPGNHSVSVQINGPGYPGCIICGEVGPSNQDYASCNLTVNGVLQ